MAEAVNFAPADWLPFGTQSIRRYKKYKKNPVFSHEELLVKTLSKDDAWRNIEHLKADLEDVVLRECEKRANLREDYGDVEVVPMYTRVEKKARNAKDAPEAETRQCFYCKTFAFFSCVSCKECAQPGIVSCLSHLEKVYLL